MKKYFALGSRVLFALKKTLHDKKNLHDKVGKNDYNLIEYDIEVEKAYFEVFLGRILYHKL